MSEFSIHDSQARVIFMCATYKMKRKASTLNAPNAKRARTRAPYVYGLNINRNANLYLVARRMMYPNRAVLRARVYAPLARHYQNRSMANIYAAVNRALARAGI